MHTLRTVKDRLRPHFVPLALLCIATLAVFLPSLNHSILENWDDGRYVTTNEAIRGITTGHIAQAFTGIFVGNYAPLHILSYAFDYQLWGMKAAGFIFTNIALHMMNGLLFYRLLIMSTFTRTAAFLASFVFLLHPVQVESVVWISERKNLLAMLFFLISFILYVSYSRLHHDSPWRSRLYSFSLLAFTCALLSKAVVVVLPAALILYDVCYPPTLNRQEADASQNIRLPDKVPFLLLALLMGVITMYAQNPDNIGRGGLTGYHGGGPYQTFLTMLPVLVRYIQLLFIPVNLSAIYDPAVKHTIDFAVAGSALIVLILAATGIYAFRKRRDLAFWYFLFFISLGPVSQIIPIITLMNDRYLYFPLLGAAALAGYCGARLCIGNRHEPVTQNNARKIGLGAVVLALPLLMLPYLSWQRSSVWQNSLTLWTDTVAKNPGSNAAWYGLAVTYQNRKQIEQAKNIYRNILSKEPAHKMALLNLAQILLEQNKLAEARPLLTTANREFPQSAPILQAYGDWYYLNGDSVNAEKQYRQALAVAPDLTQSRLHLSHILLARRDLTGAEAGLIAALNSGDNNPETYYSLACVKALKGNRTEAIKWLETALKNGYRNKRSFLENKELDSIRDTSEFRILAARYFN